MTFAVCGGVGGDGWRRVATSSRMGLSRRSVHLVCCSCVHKGISKIISKFSQSEDLEFILGDAGFG